MKKTVAKIISFMLILTICISSVDHRLEVKFEDGIYGVTNFYDLEKNTVDVLVLGSSHAFMHINTGTLWSEHGIASYVLGGSVQPLWNTYYYLKEALKYQKPKLIVLEGARLVETSEYLDTQRIIKNTYGMRMSKDKIDAIKVSAPKNQWLEYMLQYTQYHTRYSEISKEDFQKNRGTEYWENWKGFFQAVATEPLEAMDVTGEKECCSLLPKTEKYYRAILKLAAEEKIPIMVVISPYAGINNDEEKKYNEGERIAKEYDVPFINYNLLVDQIGIDWSTDAAEVSHLNNKGNKKFTTALGTYISENYSIPDRRGDNKYSSWEKNSKCLTEELENLWLNGTTETDALMEKIGQEKYDLFISIDGNCSETDENIRGIFDKLGISDTKNSSIWYKSGEKGVIWESGDQEVEKFITTKRHDFGMQKKKNEEGEFSNKILIDNIDRKKVKNGVNIVVFNTITDSVVDSFGIDPANNYQVVREKQE